MSETSFELLIGDICGHGYWWSSSTPTVFGSVFGGLTAARNTLARLGGYGSYEYNTLTLLIDIFIEKNTPDLDDPPRSQGTVCDIEDGGEIEPYRYGSTTVSFANGG